MRMQVRSARWLLGSALLVCCASQAEAGIRYVKRNAPPGGDGSSWSSAFQRVQDALAVAQSGDEVWVAANVFRPGDGASPRNVTFAIPDGVSLYGGFLGGETTLAQRDWRANETILSGDLQLDDGPGFANRADNCFHVVTAIGSSAALIDGFTIRGGHANGSGDQAQGGGVWCALGSGSFYVLNLRHLVICENEAAVGGGVYAIDSRPSFQECTLRGNRANFGGAGYFFSDVRMSSCLVQGNSAPGTVGGIHLQDGYGEFSNVTIAHNQGVGLLVCCAHNFSLIYNSILWGNVGTSGTTYAGQFQDFSGSSVLFTDIQGGPPAQLDLDPLWKDPLGPDGIAGTGDEDYRLSCASPLIDRGSNALVQWGSGFDLAGNARQIDDPATPDAGSGTAPIVDLGALEYVCACDETQNYCVLVPNSFGPGAVISGVGSTSLTLNQFTLFVTGAVPQHFGLFFYGSSQVQLPFGDGVRCVGGSLQRLGVLQLDANGMGSWPLDFTQPPASSGPHAIAAGSSWNFQFYFRDPQGGPAGWNASDGLSAHFCR